MIVSDRNGRIARIVALLLAILSIGSTAADASGSSQQRTPEYGGTTHINASEAPAALTKAYPLRTGPPATGSPSTSPLRKTRPAPSTTLAPSSSGNPFWPLWLALGVGLVLALFLFWLEIGGWQALRSSQRPIEGTDEDFAIVPALTPPATGRTKIVGSGRSAPYTPKFGTQVPGGSSRVGHERRASDGRQDPRERRSRQ